MKFMKLGSKPDAFHSDGDDTRYVVSELATDFIVHVEGVRFYLHKYPLLSKSSRLQRLVLQASEGSTDEVFMHDFPGGLKTFEICAKFCYGMTVTLNPYNVVAVRCAAEYLEMTEDIEKGNMVFKIEVFLSSSIFRSWKDSIIVLQTTEALLPWSEELKLVGRCIDSIANKVSLNPSSICWSYTYSKKTAALNEIVHETQEQLHRVVPRDWWIEDISELDVGLYKRVMVAIKSKARVSSNLIGEALKTYAVRWLPDSYNALDENDCKRRYKTLVETIVWLLPSNKGSSSGCFCKFLLKLLRVVILVGATENLKEELMNKISWQLHEASVKDLLIPAKSPAKTCYDVDLVQSLITRFMMQAGNEICDGDIFREKGGNSESGLLLKLGKLVDGYLAEVASDPYLPLSSFVEISNLVPETGRLTHDGLYAAISIFLKEHPSLPKAERMSICAVMDVKKLSRDATIHATQNDLLPLRVVVQVLFFEQAKAKINPTINNNSKPTTYIQREDEEQEDDEDEEEYARKVIADHANNNSLKKRLGSFKRTDNVKDQNVGMLQHSRSRRIFDKLWMVKGSNGENSKRSSETSGSSSSSRNRRYSVS